MKLYHTADLAVASVLFVGGVISAPYVGALGLIYTVVNIGVYAGTGLPITENIFD